MTKLGTEYELFVKDLMQAIVNSENKEIHENDIKLKHQAKIESRSGVEREFDIYWEFDINGYKYKRVIECKDYSSKVSVEKIDALRGKLAGFDHIEGSLATSNGYQHGAIKTAEEAGIELLIVRKLNEEKDYRSKDGTPLIKEIVCNLKLYLPIEILERNFYFDEDWAKENNINIINIDCREDEINIVNKSKQLNMSLYKYFSSFGRPNDTKKEIIEEKNINYEEETFLVKENEKYKINSLKIAYRIPPCIKKEVRIKTNAKGVVEYLISQKKKIVFLENNKDYVKDIS